jgi:hypothetical protein
MNSGYLYLNDKKIKLSDISANMPMTMVNNSLTIIKVCEFVCTSFFSFSKNDIQKNILLNLLKSKSEKIKIISAIILLSRKERIIRIDCNYLSSEFKEFFDYDIIFDYAKNKRQNFINSSEIKKLGIKYLINFTYRLLRNRRLKKTKSAIRTWVDVSKDIYGDKFNKSTILIYPFGLNFKRSFNYIKYTFSTYKNVSFMGVPYSFIKFLIILISTRRDLAILNFEIDGHIKHAKDLKKYEKIYTSDDFISAVPALYNQILKRTKIINTCHGIGFYNPFNNYSEFHVINSQQRKYYNYKNVGSIFYEIEKDINTLKKHESKFKKTVVIVDQGNLKKYNLFYEHNLQQKLYEKLINICKKNNHSLYIKPHPNRTDIELKKLLNRYPSLKILRNVNDLKSKNNFFVNLFSSAYYDFKNLGQFLFIKDKFFSAEIFFGNEIKLIEINEIESEIISKLKPQDD